MKKDILIYFDLLTSLKTTQEVADFVSEIDTLSFTFFKSEKGSMEEALSSISVDFAKKTMRAFAENHLDINDRETIAGFFRILKELTKKFKVIKLIFAFDPTRKTIENIHNFVKDTVGIGYILDIEVSENILGGAIVMFNGKYYDFSLKKRLEDAFTNRKEEILKFMQ